MSRNTPLRPPIDPSTVQERINVLRESRERILIRLVTSIARASTMHGTRSISHLGISLSQAIVLGEVFRNNGCRQEDLRTLVSLDKGNVTRALQRLEESGLVQRSQDALDRRAVRVYFTEKALDIEREMFALAAAWDDRLTAGFTPADRGTLVDLLLRMEANAKALAKGGGTQMDGL